MPATDKLELLRVLDVSNIITQLLDADDERKRSQTNGSGLGDDESSELYREKLARVLNGLGLELTRIIDEVRADSRLCITRVFRARLIQSFLPSVYTGQRHRRAERPGKVSSSSSKTASSALPQ